MSSPPLICLTPIKNEAWILNRFLQCTSTWADHILLADQRSEDESREIARRFDTVTLLDNPHPGYDEQARQKLLIDAARALPVDGPRILIALDADEILSANWMDSPEWDQLLSAAPGTVLRFQWANVAPGVERGWVDPERKPFGFVDDGSPHVGKPIHSPRLPVPEGAPTLTFSDIRVLHYQYANWDRMQSKQRWYQCWERLNNPEKRPITIYRQYHHMNAALRNATLLPPEWLQNYEEHGIDMRTVGQDPLYYWDEQIVDFLRTHGTAPFRRLDIWDRDWDAVGRALGHPVNGELSDPRSPLEKQIHTWLARTQERCHTIPVRTAQKLLQFAGW